VGTARSRRRDSRGGRLSRDATPPGAPGRDERIRLYGRRRGRRLRTGQAERYERLLPVLSIAAPEPGMALDPRRLFAQPVREVWLEIGFGAGEHLASQAGVHPDIGFIGCEVFENGIAALLRAIDENDLANVRLWPADARLLLPALAPSSIQRLFLLFPDPWPKARHAERRFVCPANLDLLARLLADKAELRIASDDPGYVAWTLIQMRARSDFEWLAGTPADWRARPADWPETRYEAKALAAGRRPAYLRYRRRPRIMTP
jgi:tRNA (guanine-N7-)-methyltransferase